MDRPQFAPAPAYLMVVQRGDEERYQLLTKLFQSQRVDVVRDRRTGDRRTGERRDATAPADASNRRAGERRGQLPDSWVNLGFFVARRQAR
jgi:hypothetical protein